MKTTDRPLKLNNVIRLATPSDFSGQFEDTAPPLYFCKKRDVCCLISCRRQVHTNSVRRRRLNSAVRFSAVFMSAVWPGHDSTPCELNRAKEALQHTFLLLPRNQSVQRGSGNSCFKNGLRGK